MHPHASTAHLVDQIEMMTQRLNVNHVTRGFSRQLLVSWNAASVTRGSSRARHLTNVSRRSCALLVPISMSRHLHAHTVTRERTTHRWARLAHAHPVHKRLPTQTLALYQTETVRPVPTELQRSYLEVPPAQSVMWDSLAKVDSVGSATCACVVSVMAWTIRRRRRTSGLCTMKTGRPCT